MAMRPAVAVLGLGLLLLLLPVGACGSGGSSPAVGLDDTISAEDVDRTSGDAAAPSDGPPPPDGGLRADASSSADGGHDVAATPCEIEPTLSSLAEEYFAGSCAFSSCHSPTERAGGLDLTPENAFVQLVNVPSTLDASIPRVVPGDPDGSFLVQKVEGPASGHGGLMPPGIGEPLDPACRIAMLRKWILEDAVP